MQNGVRLVLDYPTGKGFKGILKGRNQSTEAKPTLSMLAFVINEENHNELLNSGLQHCQVLSDDKKRALYDQYGEVVVKSSVGGGSSAYATNPFETFFGPSMGGFAGIDPIGFGTRRRCTVTKGEDIR
ncbi:Molecular chaperone Hsp40/DnaJ family protein [Trifolium repens]|nr:Molecular chaperone Hsp40/DnaJ family protein [Trifolium repens]